MLHSAARCCILSPDAHTVNEATKPGPRTAQMHFGWIRLAKTGWPIQAGLPGFCRIHAPASVKRIEATARPLGMCCTLENQRMYFCYSVLHACTLHSLAATVLRVPRRVGSTCCSLIWRRMSTVRRTPPASVIFRPHSAAATRKVGSERTRRKASATDAV